MDENPYASPTAEPEFPEADDLDLKQYGGIGRSAYVGATVVVTILANLIVGTLEQLGVREPFVVVISIALWFLHTLPAYYRLRNIGTNPWWSLAINVPILNVLIGARCLIAPKGYADTKTLDVAGKIIAGTLVLLFVIAMIVVFVWLSNPDSV